MFSPFVGAITERHRAASHPGHQLRPDRPLPSLPLLHQPVRVVPGQRLAVALQPVLLDQRGCARACSRDDDTDKQPAVPSDFDIEPSGQSLDRSRRPELNYGVIEFVAPNEYMVRPPQPPVYVFIIDVSLAAVESGVSLCYFSSCPKSCRPPGMVQLACKTLQHSLDQIPNHDRRTQIAILTVDSSIHFYSLDVRLASSRYCFFLNKSTQTALSRPQVLVMSDLDEVFLPQPMDLLVNLASSREVRKATRLFRYCSCCSSRVA